MPSKLLFLVSAEGCCCRSLCKPSTRTLTHSVLLSQEPVVERSLSSENKRRHRGGKATSHNKCTEAFPNVFFSLVPSKFQHGLSLATSTICHVCRATGGIRTAI